MRKLGLFSIGIATIPTPYRSPFSGDTQPYCGGRRPQTTWISGLRYQTPATSSEAPLALRLFTTAVKDRLQGQDHHRDQQ